MEATKATPVESLLGEKIDALRQCVPVRISAPELGGDIVIILARADESIEQALSEALDDLREKNGWTELRNKAITSWAKDNPY
jgi:hypothetical protein